MFHNSDRLQCSAIGFTPTVSYNPKTWMARINTLNVIISDVTVIPYKRISCSARAMAFTADDSHVVFLSPDYEGKLESLAKKNE